MKLMIKSLLVSAILLTVVPVSAALIELTPQIMELNSRIRYTLVGQYKPLFNEFEGNVDFDHQKQSFSNLNFTINVDSLQSNYPKLDEIALSRRFLDVKNHPQVKFQSTEFESKDDGSFQVTGIVTLHGQEHEMTFDFFLQEEDDTSLRAAGSWRIPRKKFGLIWHPLLDQGGVVVSNYIILDWEFMIPPPSAT